MKDKMRTFGGGKDKGFSLPSITTKPSKIDSEKVEKEKEKVRVRTHR